MWKKYIKPYRYETIFGLFFKLVEAIFELFVPFIVSLIVDKGIQGGNRDYIIKMGLLLYGLAAIGYLFALVCQYFASKASQGFGTGVRRDMFAAINAYDYKNIDDIGTPSLITRLSHDVNQLQVAVAMGIRLASRSPIIIIGSLIMSFYINSQLAIIFVVCAPLLALSIYLVMKHSFPLYLKIQNQLDKVSLVTRENLSGMRVIRAFSMQSKEKQRFQDETSYLNALQVKVTKISALLNPSTTIIVNIAIIVILYVGGMKINVGQLSTGEVIALINYMNQILLSMIVFANVILIFNKASASYRRVEEVLAIEPEIEYGTTQLSLDSEECIRFSHVSFAYEQAQALSDVSFQVKRGQTIGIIGGTGSGKTSLVNLITRFYDPSDGEIDLFHHSIKEYTQEQLRDMIALVPQTAVLFKGTIKENLLWGKKDANEEDIERALEQAQAKEFVDLMEKGVDSELSQGGSNLSGGQRQRLTIARALIKNADILILDDSSSALDFVTESKLRKSLQELEQTTLIVSQRISSLQHADVILVLYHGKLVGQGTHYELLENCPVYQDIYVSQNKKEDQS